MPVPEIGRTKVLGSSTRNDALHVVLTTQRFASVPDFAGYAEKLLARFSPEQHVLLVTHETPFPEDYFPARRDVKSAIGQLKDITRKNPRWKIAFTVNETSQLKRTDGTTTMNLRTHSNSAYVVGCGIGRNGHVVYSKIELPSGDLENMGAASGTGNMVAAKDIWERSARLFRARRQPFPLFEAGGKRVMLKTCADAIINSPAGEDLAVVPADELRLNDKEIHHKLILVNDGTWERRLILNGNPVNVFFLDTARPDPHGKLGALLAREGMVLHLVDPYKEPLREKAGRFWRSVAGAAKAVRGRLRSGAAKAT